jgi:hypothetical protein
MTMGRIDDVARFAPSENDDVVAAALDCPYCLSQPAHVLIHDSGDGATALCACSRCDLQWSVALDPDQALRLFVAPPRGLWIQHSLAAPA